MAWRMALRTTLGLLGFSAVLLGMAWLVIHGLIGRRLAHLTARAQSIANGTDNGPALKGSDEFAEIDAALVAAKKLVAEKESILVQKEQRYRAMLDASPAPTIVLRQQIIEYVNPVLLRTLGYEASEVLGKCPLLFIPEAYQPLVRERLSQLDKEETNMPEIELQLAHKDGHMITFISVSSSFDDSRGLGTQVVLQDITSRKQLEQEQTRLAQEIARVSDAEKWRIGQDLHDDVCQRLVAVKMALQDMEEELADRAPSLVGTSDRIVERLDETIQITRQLARSSAPIEIGSGGLAIGLDALVKAKQGIHSIRCEVQREADVTRLSEHQATQLYRIAQEAINNAIRHGGAKSVVILLKSTSTGLRMSVQNDGIPFSPDFASHKGMGLHIMRHRAASIGAKLHFDSSDSTPHAVAVHCDLPLPLRETSPAIPRP
jgi:PAS domain S-box-containing protein